MSDLTVRQYRLLRMLLTDRTMDEICAELGLTENHLQTDCDWLFRNMGIRRGRIELMAFRINMLERTISKLRRRMYRPHRRRSERIERVPVLVQPGKVKSRSFAPDDDPFTFNPDNGDPRTCTRCARSFGQHTSEGRCQSPDN